MNKLFLICFSGFFSIGAQEPPHISVNFILTNNHTAPGQNSVTVTPTQKSSDILQQQAQEKEAAQPEPEQSGILATGAKYVVFTAVAAYMFLKPINMVPPTGLFFWR